MIVVIPRSIWYIIFTFLILSIIIITIIIQEYQDINYLIKDTLQKHKNLFSLSPLSPNKNNEHNSLIDHSPENSKRDNNYSYQHHVSKGSLIRDEKDVIAVINLKTNRY